ncbi:MAG: hypothetical protein IJS04_07430 [Muribaculaceae bacterium]|nr:hypothetical protein [Muribaculaceae bacterium]
MMALTAGPLFAQDYDDIYYDASKPATVKTTVVKPAKTIAVYGEVPENYKVVSSNNYRAERDVDEYNRHGVEYDSLSYEVDINGDTIFEDAFANTRRIERFYNPDIVILSDDDDLVELYYDESPTINLVVGSDWGYGNYYGWASSYYPWYTGWYEPWYVGYGWYGAYGWYSPWSWHYPWYYGYYSNWHWGWHYSPWYRTGWGWGHPYGWGHHWYSNPTYYGHTTPHYNGHSWRAGGHRQGLAANRNGRSRVGLGNNHSRSGIAARGADGNRGSGIGSTTRSRGSGSIGSRGGNMGSRGTSGVTSRSSSVSRSSSGGGRSYSGGSSSGGGRSYSGGSSSGGSRSYSSGSSSSGGSRSYSGGSSSGGGSRGSSGGGGGGSHGGGGHRR